MAGHAFVVAREILHHRNGNILTLWNWLYDKKQFFLFKFNYIKKHLYLVNKSLKTEIYWPVQFSHQTCIGEPTKHAHGC